MYLVGLHIYYKMIHGPYNVKTFAYFSAINYIDNTISIRNTSDIKTESYTDIYIISAFVFTFEVFF